MANPKWSRRGRGVSVEETDVGPIHIIRTRNVPAASLIPLAEAIGWGLDDRPNRSADNRIRASWLAPGDWMLVGDIGSQDLADVGDPLVHLADVTDGRVVFLVSGPSARNLLAKGTSLDLHPRAFAVGHCAQTLFAQLRVLIDQMSEAPEYRLYSDVSYRTYLRAWFDEAMIEFT